MGAVADIGVIGVPGEPHAAFVLDGLRTRGMRPLFVSSAPAESGGLSLEDGVARYGDVDLSTIPVFYLRTVYVGAIEQREADVDWRTEYAADRERQGLWVSWLRATVRRGQSMVNPLEANELHHLKPFALDLLREAGVPVPATLVTSDAAALRRFRDRHGQVICKPVAGGALARLLTEGDFADDRLALLHQAPVLFQEYVPGRDLRVYTVGTSVVAAGVIHTDAVDYRAAEGATELVSLGADTETLAVKAAITAGCRFCAIDMKWTADGRYVVLDCNPSPMFLGFDRKTGARVGERLVEFLAHEAGRVRAC